LGKLQLNLFLGGILMKKVAIVTEGGSDFSTVKETAAELEKFGIPYEVHVMSAHRTPGLAAEFSKNAAENGFGVIISASEKIAFLACEIASNTILPVIGIPVKSLALDGLDALLSTVQMPRGVPVASVAINGGVNAAILAAQILALSDKELDKKLCEMKEEMAAGVIKKDEKLQEEVKNIFKN
jgi:5-(carboxyamino)imidazole ribonucleotide mutase